MRLAVEPPTWLDQRDEYDQRGEMAVAVAGVGRGRQRHHGLRRDPRAGDGLGDPGRLSHACRGRDGRRRFRIFEVWESQDHFDRFAEERLMPILREVGADGDPPKLPSYELHEYIAT